MNLALLLACASARGPEESSAWFDPGGAADVEEPLVFTDAAYDFPSSAADGIGAVAELARGIGNTDSVLWAPGDEPGEGGCDAEVSDALEDRVVEGVVTLHPRYYFKTAGCGRDSDDKYYGSYFLEDATGGIFILGDTKAQVFGAGDRLRVLVRAVRGLYTGDESTVLPAVYAHDRLEVVARDVPIAFETLTREPTTDDVGRVFRLTGTVAGPMSEFGELPFQPDFVSDDDFLTWPLSVKLDQELTRRGLVYTEGARLQVTGPLIDSYGMFLVVMQLGQIEPVE